MAINETKEEKQKNMLRAVIVCFLFVAAIITIIRFWELAFCFYGICVLLMIPFIAHVIYKIKKAGEK